MSAVLAPPPAPSLTRYSPPSRALADAMGSAALRRQGCAAQVLVILHELLTPWEYRRVKPWYVAERLGIHRVQASRAIAHLADAGLIVRGDREGGFPTFRIPGGETPTAGKVA